MTGIVRPPLYNLTEIKDRLPTTLPMSCKELVSKYAIRPRLTLKMGPRYALYDFHQALAQHALNTQAA
jgi:hypothetical protein